MNIQAEAAIAMQSKIMFDARERLMQVQVAPVAASAPVTEHADVVLSLSAAAKSLTSLGG